MARPIEFDRPKAVNRALGLFWRQGYQATSLADLLAAMGIGRSSFYAAFTDKRSFYIECLDLWAARTLESLQRAPADMTPVDALQSFFERSFVVARGAKADRGCMLVNTVLEMAGVDDELAARASHHLRSRGGMLLTFQIRIQCMRIDRFPRLKRRPILGSYGMRLPHADEQEKIMRPDQDQPQISYQDLMRDPELMGVLQRRGRRLRAAAVGRAVSKVVRRLFRADAPEQRAPATPCGVMSNGVRNAVNC